MKKISVYFAIAALTSSALMVSAGFQAARADDPCHSDWEKYCSKYNDMEGAVKCLTEHKAQLNPACKKLFGG